MYYKTHVFLDFLEIAHLHSAISQDCSSAEVIFCTDLTPAKNMDFLKSSFVSLKIKK